MPFISQLDVINEMLASLGESPINAVNEGHPLVAAGLRMLRVANLREQSKSWWFNKEFVTLLPDVTDKRIYTPADAIRIDPTDGTANYVQRGNKLYRAYAPASIDRYAFDNPVPCWLVRLVPFEDLPPSAAVVISYAAQLDFQKAYDADAQKYRLIATGYADALKDLNAEHTRNVNANMLQRPGVQAILNQITPQSNAGIVRAPYGMI